MNQITITTLLQNCKKNLLWVRIILLMISYDLYEESEIATQVPMIQEQNLRALIHETFAIF